MSGFFDSIGSRIENYANKYEAQADGIINNLKPKDEEAAETRDQMNGLLKRNSMGSMPKFGGTHRRRRKSRRHRTTKRRHRKSRRHRK